MDLLASGARKLGLELTTRQLEQFETYYRELADWNKKFNLTAITGYEEVQVKHFLDSLSVIFALKGPFTADLSMIDVGTGAGLPGIPLKIVLPEIKLALLEATAKKATFLRHMVERLGLEKVEVVVGRAEEMAHQSQFREAFAVVLSRAVARLAALVELTLPFCAIGGRLIAQKSGDISEEIKEAEKAIGVLGGALREVIDVPLAELAGHKLIVIEKIAPTPSNYPRRPGIPVKRPIL